ncbi:MAG: Lrp/AsnC family transcriptional regulator [Methylococcales bacterium]
MQLLNDYQQDFPLTPRPYLAIAESLGVSEDDVLLAMQELTDQTLINRIGTIIKPNKMGKSMLVAMAVPEAQLQRVAGIVSSFSEVNHNYERENRFNLWFVLMSSTGELLQDTLDEIEQQCGYSTMRLPLVADYFINLGFELDLERDQELDREPDNGCDRLSTN